MHPRFDHHLSPFPGVRMHTGQSGVDSGDVEGAGAVRRWWRWWWRWWTQLKGFVVVVVVVD